MHNMDQLLRALGNPHLPFGEKIVVFGGDFRQCLPVQQRDVYKRQQQRQACRSGEKESD